eukprot:9716168-Alexandrium_andersonii.AAC.1
MAPLQAPPSYAGNVLGRGPSATPFGGGLAALQSGAGLLSEEQRQEAIQRASERGAAVVFPERVPSAMEP